MFGWNCLGGLCKRERYEKIIASEILSDVAETAALVAD